MDKVYGYIRVSTDDQGTNGAGLDVQREAIQAECKRRGWHLIGIEEDVLSGRTLKRPGLQRVLAACRAGEASGIVVAKLDRLSRSLIDFAGLLETARREGWNVVALDLGIDLSTPHGEFLANVMASAAQWERRMISQRTKEALAIKKAQGVRIGRPRLMDPEIREWIHLAREKGMSYREIAHRLDKHGVPTPSGGEFWNYSTVRFTLKSKAS